MAEVNRPPEPRQEDHADPEPPQDVKDAGLMWVWTCLLQALYGIATGVEMGTDKAALQAQMDEISKSYGDLADSLSTGTLAIATGAIIAVSMIILAGVFFFFVKKTMRGRVWAKTILFWASIYMVLNAVLSAFSLPDAASVWYLWTGGVLTILSGVLAGTGAWFISRPKAKEFFH